MMGNLTAELQTSEKGRFQFITSPVAFLPPVASGFLLAFDFEHIQFISWILLAMTSYHGTINCLVMILTCPPYRVFVKNKILKIFCVEK